MELKTLKDLECVRDEEYSCCGGNKSKHNNFKYDSPWSSDEELRKEAIKWIKEITKEGINRCPQITITGEKDQLMKAMITAETSLVVDWIKHFFNITKEELE